MSNSNAYHIPVLLEESLEALSLKEGGVYVDATLGGGGHTKALLERVPSAKVYGFDKDLDAQEKALSWASEQVQVVASDFRYMKRFLKLYGISQVDGILADLGVSSWQIDTPERGFSIRFEGPLDMRMNTSTEKTAANVINDYAKADLFKVLAHYGEVRNPNKLSDAILAARVNHRIESTFKLMEVIKPLAPRNQENRYMAQVFQALRIEVNEELEGLKDFLKQTPELLKQDGRVAIISYHSLEDRLVKRFFHYGNFEGEPKKDVYGNLLRPLQPLNRKPIVPREEEILQNPRARSAKLRIAISA